MIIIINGYKNPDEILQKLQDDNTLQDEILYHNSNNKQKVKRVIITPFYLWDAEAKYKYKSDCIICTDAKISIHTVKKYNITA